MLPKQFLYILFFACLLSSCVKDLSNDVFTPVNDIEISGIEPAYTVVILDSFKIQPVLTPSLQQQSDDLEFYWILYDPVKTYFSADTLSKERNLDILVNTAPGTYKITYRVKNRHTGVAYRYEFSVTIISELQRGLLVLSDLNGKANVTFVSVTGDLYEDIYENINGEIAGTHPVSIRYTYRAPLDYVVILCDDARGGVVLSSLSFKKLFNYSDYFYDPLGTIKPQAFEVIESYGSVTDYQASGGRAYFTNNNQLHLLDANYTVSVDGVNTTVESKAYSAFPGDYKISPVSFRALGLELFYDQKYQRFMYIADYNKPNLLVVAGNTTEPFNPANVGLELVWGKLTKSSRGAFDCNSVFKDNGGNWFYIKFAMTNKAAPNPLKKVAIPSDFKIRQATGFAGNTLEEYIYFAVGSKIYVYDCILNQEREVFDFGPGKQVDNIRWHDAVILSRIMHISISEPGVSGKNGSIYEMTVAPNGSMTIKNEYKNVCGRVVSMHWKN